MVPILWPPNECDSYFFPVLRRSYLLMAFLARAAAVAGCVLLGLALSYILLAGFFAQYWER